MQTRELDTSKGAPESEAPDSRRGRDVLRKQNRLRESADRARGRGPEHRGLERREGAGPGPAGGRTPTRTRGEAGGPSAVLEAEAEAAASSCSGRPGQAASSSRPPSCSHRLLNFFPTVNTPAAKERAYPEPPPSAEARASSFRPASHQGACARELFLLRGRELPAAGLRAGLQFPATHRSPYRQFPWNKKPWAAS